ncbi:hypothetical protein BGZ95_007501, partial [Linnemannia exigua]
MLKATALYTCTNGEQPIFKSDCAPDRCSATKESMGVASVIFKKLDDDTCQNSCLCSGEGPACGSSFPEKCNLKEGGLYKCTGKDQAPSLIEECKDGICVIHPGDDSCGDANTCLCIDTDDVCGNAFPSLCNYQLDSLYKCEGGAGSTPTIKETCASKKCKIEPGNDVCIDDPCACKDGTAACGSTFPPECGLDKDTLYTCSAAGAGPAAGDKCTSGCQVTPTGADNCKADCTCKDGTAACGSTFPPECGFDKDTVYKCDGGIGTTPVPGDKCKAGECLVVDGTDGCRPEPPTDCKCKDDKDICGSEYAPVCGFDKDTLYTCSAAGADPVIGEKCASGCQITPIGDDKCMPDCTCKDGTAACGSTFPPECGLDKDTLYTCSAAGADPAAGDKCTSGCQVTPTGADNCKADCTCKDGTAACGSTFPPECGFDKDTVYKCDGGIGTTPVPGDKCKAGECLV